MAVAKRPLRNEHVFEALQPWRGGRSRCFNRDKVEKYGTEMQEWIADHMSSFSVWAINHSNYLLLL